jgi:DNA-binding Xre family transcriptional regulator
MISKIAYNQEMKNFLSFLKKGLSFSFKPCYNIRVMPSTKGFEIMEISYKKLWKILIDKDMNKTDLQSASKVSWASITKLSKGEHVSLDVLIKVCMALKCDIGDIVELVLLKTQS